MTSHRYQQLVEIITNTEQKGCPLSGPRKGYAYVDRRTRAVGPCIRFRQEPRDHYRYSNVICLDSTRIHLSGDRFYHGNRIPSLEVLCKYRHPWIGCEGPMENTWRTFWSMVEQKRVGTIIMLCDFVEMGTEKCYRYFPTDVGEEMVIGEGSVRLDSVSAEYNGQLLHRKLCVTGRDRTTRYIDHLQYVGWSDHNVPSSPDAVTDIIKKVATTKEGVVVHCSAGIGRTGATLLAQLGIMSLEKKQLFLWKLLERLRGERAGAVQGEIQFLFALLVIIKYGQNEGHFSSRKHFLMVQSIERRFATLKIKLDDALKERRRVAAERAARNAPLANGGAPAEDEQGEETDGVPTGVEHAAPVGAKTAGVPTGVEQAAPVGVESVSVDRGEAQVGEEVEDELYPPPISFLHLTIEDPVDSL